MNKKQVTAIMAEKNSISKAEAGRILQTFIDTAIECLKNGNRVTISGLGTFKVVKRRPRQGVNPRTKKRIKIASATIIKFAMAAPVRNLLNK